MNLILLKTSFVYFILLSVAFDKFFWYTAVFLETNILITVAIIITPNPAKKAGPTKKLSQQIPNISTYVI